MRLFIAINFPAEMRERLWEACAPLRAKRHRVRWVRAELLHLTVKFLGEVDEGRIPDIEAHLRSAVNGTRAFQLPVREFGTFPTAKHPRVLWVGCEELPVLELLYDSVEREMSALEFALEGRPFRPHVAIGRVARGARKSEFKGLHRDLEELDFFEEVGIASVDIMQSVLSGDGPRYTRLAAVELSR